MLAAENSNPTVLDPQDFLKELYLDKVPWKSHYELLHSFPSVKTAQMYPKIFLVLK